MIAQYELQDIERTPRMGRPREFCLEAALEKALGVFWRRGFAGASMAELTTAMGITKPSLYASYGNKEELFRRALDLYDAKHMGFLRDALLEATPRRVAMAVLVGMAAATAADGERPAGCLGVNGALSCAAAAEPIRLETLRRRQIFEAQLAQRFACDAAEARELPFADPDALASFVMTMACGIACQAAAGVPYARLCDIAELALAGWSIGHPVSAARDGEPRAAPLSA